MPKGEPICRTPKRGALPTPRNVLASATPYDPASPGLGGNPSTSGSNIQAASPDQPHRGMRKNDPKRIV